MGEGQRVRAIRSIPLPRAATFPTRAESATSAGRRFGRLNEPACALRRLPRLAGENTRGGRPDNGTRDPGPPLTSPPLRGGDDPVRGQEARSAVSNEPACALRRLPRLAGENTRGGRPDNVTRNPGPPLTSPP